MKSTRLFLAATLLAGCLASCSKDGDNGVLAIDKKLSKYVLGQMSEELVDGEWVVRRAYSEEYTSFHWDGDRVTAITYGNTGEGYTLSYDTDGRISTIFSQCDEVEETVEYDEQGRVWKIYNQDGQASYTYSYDDMGNITEVMLDGDDGGRHLYFTWNNGNVVREIKQWISDEMEPDTTYYTYSNKVNPIRCLPTDFVAAMGISEGPVLSVNFPIAEGLEEYTYGGNYVVKIESVITYDNDRWTSIQRFEYTDGKGRR